MDLKKIVQNMWDYKAKQLKKVDYHMEKNGFIILEHMNLAEATGIAYLLVADLLKLENKKEAHVDSILAINTAVDNKGNNTYDMLLWPEFHLNSHNIYDNIQVKGRYISHFEVKKDSETKGKKRFLQSVDLFTDKGIGMPDSEITLYKPRDTPVFYAIKFR